MFALKKQIFSICTDHEKDLYQMAEDRLGGEFEVVIQLNDCIYHGITGDIRFSEVARVAASRKERIAPRYLKDFKNVYLRYLMALLHKKGLLEAEIEQEFGFNKEPLASSEPEFEYYRADND